MPIRFDEDLSRLKKNVLTMGAMAQGMIRDTIAALVDRNEAHIRSVLETEKKMDAFQREVDNETVRLIGVYTPVAVDLRMLLMITRINAELERIGDQTVTNCYSYQDLKILEEPPLKPLVDLPSMAALAQEMLRKALDAFGRSSAEESQVVIQSDTQVDRLNDQIFKDLLSHMVGDAQNTRRGLGLILAARGFERIADHAVNIAEDVIYIVRGEDIRHVS